MFAEGWYDPEYEDVLSSLSAGTPSYIKDLESRGFSYEEALEDAKEAFQNTYLHGCYKSEERFMIYIQEIALASFIKKLPLDELEDFISTCELPNIDETALIADLKLCKKNLETIDLYPHLFSGITNHNVPRKKEMLEYKTAAAVQRLRDALFAN